MQTNFLCLIASNLSTRTSAAITTASTVDAHEILARLRVSRDKCITRHIVNASCFASICILGGLWVFKHVRLKISSCTSNHHPITFLELTLAVSVQGAVLVLIYDWCIVHNTAKCVLRSTWDTCRWHGICSWPKLSSHQKVILIPNKTNLE